MDLKLTCSNPANMTDTNKLLYFICSELEQLKQIVGVEFSPPHDDSKLFEVVDGTTKENVSEGQTKDNALKCKYCGRVIEGNKGNLLAHIRKCDKRASKKEVK